MIKCLPYLLILLIAYLTIVNAAQEENNEIIPLNKQTQNQWIDEFIQGSAPIKIKSQFFTIEQKVHEQIAPEDEANNKQYLSCVIELLYGITKQDVETIKSYTPFPFEWLKIGKEIEDSFFIISENPDPIKKMEINIRYYLNPALQKLEILESINNQKEQSLWTVEFSTYLEKIL